MGGGGANHDRQETRESPDHGPVECTVTGLAGLETLGQTLQEVKAAALVLLVPNGGGGGDKYDLCYSLQKNCAVQVRALPEAHPGFSMNDI
jgi:hypothetical protein